MNFEKQLYESGLIADGCWDQLDDYAKGAILRFGEAIVNQCETSLNEMHRYARIPILIDIENATIEDCILTIKNSFGVE